MLLFTVEDRFLITGLGIVLAPGLGKTMAKVNDKIRLIKPDKTTIDTTIQGIIFETKGILIGAHLTKADIPIGTEVWLVE